MKRKINPTKEEVKLATELQAPVTRGRKPAKVTGIDALERKTKAAKPASNEPAIVGFGAAQKAVASSYNQDEGTPLEWVKAGDMIGVPFYIHRASVYDTEFGSAVSFTCELAEHRESEPNVRKFLVSLKWNKTRDKVVKEIKAITRKNRAAVIGPVVFDEIDVGQANPYIDIQSYRE